MGKYDKLKDRFPQLKFDPSNAHEALIHKRLQELLRELPERKFITERFKTFRAEKEELEERLKAVNVEIKALDAWLGDYLETEQLSTIKDEEGFAFREQVEPYCSVVDKMAFDEWAEKSGWKELYTINHQTLNGNVKALLLENQPVPPGVGVFMKRKIVMTRPR